MSAQTKIQWCDSTINFWSGCTMVPAADGLKDSGCLHCYAKARDDRHMIEPVSHWGRGAKRLKHVGAVNQAMALNRKPFICDDCGEAYSHWSNATTCSCSFGQHGIHQRRIFSLSLGDWLDEDVPIEWLAEMLATIRQCDQVIWILCTKRPELWQARLSRAMDTYAIGSPAGDWIFNWLTGQAPAHIWLLCSVENQPMADKRIPELLKIPAVCRGLSLEPLLGPMTDIWPYCCKSKCAQCLDMVSPDFAECPNCKNGTFQEVAGLDWLIIGGESGSDARPCNVEWIRSIVEQGKSAGVATFVKQLGTAAIQREIIFDSERGINGQPKDWQLNLKDKKGGDPAEWPEDLRVQQWPQVAPGEHPPMPGLRRDKEIKA